MSIDKSKFKSSVKNIKFSAPSSLFGDMGEEIQMLPIKDLEAFPNHPFQVLEDENMEMLKESIREHGVVNPILVRSKPNGKYEIIAGHRRTKAASLLGLTEMPSLVKELDEDDAVLYMVDTNIQREELLPSEKAFAYKMKTEALKRKAGRPSKDEVPLGKSTRALLAEQGNDSSGKIQRFIRLTFLCPTLLRYTDEKKISMLAAVDASHMSLEEQNILLQVMEELQCSISTEQSKLLKQHSEAGTFTEEVCRSMLEESTKPTKKTTIRIEYEKYFPKKTSKKEMEAVIEQLLIQWQAENNKNK